MALRQGQVQILVATDVAARGIDVPTITHVFNYGLPMKAEDYTHRIGRTGRAGRDGLAVTFAEIRDRRRIFDIEAYTRQHFKSEVIPGLEPQQRFPEARPGTGASFGGRGSHVADHRPRERKFGPGPRDGGFGDNRGGFGGRPAPAPRDFGNNARDFGGAAREGFSYERKGGFNDRFASRGEGPAPRGDFAARKPAFAKPAAFAKPGNAGKVFVPRDAKRVAKPAR
jgi:hypothetical protein